MNRRRLPGVRGISRNKKAAAGAAVAAAVAVAGLGAAPAQSVPDPSCPTPYPVADLVKDQAVNGLTVTTGTTPEAFSGTVLGVLADGIGPDLDMIMVRLTSPELTRVGGIWQGMSGSPVYADDGRLIGAVAYGLSAGPSTVAGVTPAADMEALLTNPPAAAEFRNQVAIPKTMAREIVASGSATNREVSEGMAQLKLPFGISGFTANRHFRQIKKLHTLSALDGVRMMQSGGTSAIAAVDEIVPGGNLAASISFGDVTAAGVGTATAVCGDEVLAFGHPMNFTGPATLTMHGANALYIQEDPTFAPFKLANITGPAGTITDDRLAGLRGLVGAAPETMDITSFVEMGSKSRTGTTSISVPDAVPDIATSHLLADQDRIFDGIGKGSGTVSWTIKGVREDGSRFRLVRNDRYADARDLTFLSAIDLNDTLNSIAFNGAEDVEITSIDTSSQLSRDYLHYTLDSVKVRESGQWNPLNTNRVLAVRAGSTKKFQVKLISSDLATRKVVVAVPIPSRAAGKPGSIDIFGGNSGLGFDGGFFGLSDFGEFGGDTGAGSFPEVLSSLRRAPHNDDVVASLNMFLNGGGTLSRTRHTSAEQVVDGSVTVEVFGTK